MRSTRTSAPAAPACTTATAWTRSTSSTASAPLVRGTPPTASSHPTATVVETKPDASQLEPRTGSLNVIALRNGESVASTSWCFGGGFSNCSERLSPCRRCCSSSGPWERGRRIKPHGFALEKAPLWEGGLGAGGAAPAALNAVSKSRGGAENGETVNL